MEVVQTLVNAAVVAAVGLVLGWMVHGLQSEVRSDIARLDGKMASLRSELKTEISELRIELKSDIALLRAEMREELRSLRSDLTQVALAVGARPRAGNQ